MEVIAHRAVAANFEVVTVGIFGEQIEEEQTVGIDVKNILASVAALGDVMRQPWDVRCGHIVAHTETARKALMKTGARVTVPDFPEDFWQNDPLTKNLAP